MPIPWKALQQISSPAESWKYDRKIPARKGCGDPSRVKIRAFLIIMKQTQRPRTKVERRDSPYKRDTILTPP